MLTGCGGRSASSNSREQLAYSLDRETDALRSGIFVADTNGHRRRLVEGTPPEASSAVWSPRGDWILVEIETGTGELFETIRPDGSETHRLGLAWRARWSPAGDLIALVQEHGAINLLRPTGRRLRTLRVPIGSEQLTEEVSWSPDGAFLTTARETLKYVGDVFPSTIVKLRTSGGRPMFLRGPGKVDTGAGALWSPDGRWLAFARSTATSESDELWLMHPDGRGQRRVAPQVEAYAWSPDGRSVLAQLGTRGVYAFPLDGGRAIRVGPVGRGLLASQGRYRTRLGDDVSWAPDGRRVVRVDRDGRIVISRPDGSDSRALTDPHQADRPLWSPDGKRIAYMREYPVQIQNPGIYVVRRDGSNDRLVGRGFVSAWTRDGRRLLLVNDSSFRLLDLASGRIVFGPIRGRTPALSPDSSSVAFVRDRLDDDGNPYDSVLYVESLDGSAPRPLARAHAADLDLSFDFPVWAPDGKNIFIEQDDRVGDVEGSIRRIALDGTAGEVLAHERLSNFRNLVVSPDGRRLAFTTDDGIQTLDLEDGSRQHVPNTPRVGLDQFEWSPDGNWLAYVAPPGERYEGRLVAVSPDGSDLTVVSARAQAVDWFDWRPMRR